MCAHPGFLPTVDTPRTATSGNTAPERHTDWRVAALPGIWPRHPQDDVHRRTTYSVPPRFRDQELRRPQAPHNGTCSYTAGGSAIAMGSRNRSNGVIIRCLSRCLCRSYTRALNGQHGRPSRQKRRSAACSDLGRRPASDSSSAGSNPRGRTEKRPGAQALRPLRGGSPKVKQRSEARRRERFTRDSPRASPCGRLQSRCTAPPLLLSSFQPLGPHVGPR